jgi:hydroxylysine kinase
VSHPASLSIASPLEADALLLTSPPRILVPDAERVARACYSGFDACTPLAGERDVNFRIAKSDGKALTLKFINSAEGLGETEMQISVLRHLEGMEGVAAPRHQEVDASASVRAKDGIVLDANTADWLFYEVQDEAAPVRVRAYSYLEGVPGSQLHATPAAWSALGRTVALLDSHLAGFDHVAAHRSLLWDTCQVLGIRPMMNALADTEERQLIEEFLDLFEHDVSPVLSSLPRQVIHNDLSPSNLLVDDKGETPVGILDFGDMVYAPRIAEIAVAASYQMARCANPMSVLDAMLAGYETVSRLRDDERRHVIDLVLARLAQRMVITSWRAVRFPANRSYILRSHDAAKALFVQIYEQWKQGVVQRRTPHGENS